MQKSNNYIPNICILNKIIDIDGYYKTFTIKHIFTKLKHRLDEVDYNNLRFYQKIMCNC